MGYWAPGQLYKLAKAQGVTHVRIDVLEREMHPYSVDFENIFDVYHEKLLTQVRAKHLLSGFIARFVLDYDFDQEREASGQRSVGRGDPYTLKLTLESHAGDLIEARLGGYCRPHDPSKEQRSLRF